MNICKNKFLTKTIVSICVFMALVTFAVPNKAYAADDVSWGGTLLTPIVDILVALGDTIMEILHESIQEQDLAIIRIDGSEAWWEVVAGFLSTLLAIFIAVVVIAVVVLATGGVGAAGAALTGGVIKAAFISKAVEYGVVALLMGAGVRNN